MSDQLLPDILDTSDDTNTDERSKHHDEHESNEDEDYKDEGDDDEDENDEDENDEDENDEDEDDEDENDEDENNEDEDDEDNHENEEQVAKIQRKKRNTKKTTSKRKMAEAIIEAHKKARIAKSVGTKNMDGPSSSFVAAPLQDVEVSLQDIKAPLQDAEVPPQNVRVPLQNVSVLPLNNINLNEADPKIGTKRNDLVYIGGGEWVNFNNLREGMVRFGFVYLGEGEWIRDIALNFARTRLRPSIFVTKMAYALWGYEELANRNVANREGQENRPLLEDTKKSVLIKEFEKYLRNRDKVTQATEMDSINAYLGRAIGGARSRIKRERKKANNNRKASGAADGE